MTNSTNITVVIHTYNSGDDIADCIGSARLLTDSIIVIDMDSQDDTISLVKKMNVVCFSFPRSKYVEPARGFGINKAVSDWVFILDSDERMTKELSLEIKKAILTNNCSHYRVPRKNIFGKKKWLRHGGWWPDYQIRLIDKKSFIIWPKEIHSTPKITGNSKNLTQPLVHYFHGQFEEMVKKTLVFEDIESELLFKAARPVTILTFFRKFTAELVRRLVKSAGFLDGQIGIIEGIYQAYSKTITYLFLYEKTKRRPL